MTGQTTGPREPRPTEFDVLLAAQHDRFRTLDPLLGAPAPPHAGEPLTARGPDGAAVAGVRSYERVSPTALASLWSAREVWTLHPVLGAHPDGMDALLTAWRLALDPEQVRGPDTACVLTWPSRDAAATKALLAHGFVPLSTLAAKIGLDPPERALPDGVTVRRAGLDDLPEAVELAYAELEYSAQVGGAIQRPEARALKRTALGYRLRTGSEVLLAERAGEVVGMAETLTPGEAGDQDHLLARALWGYVNCAVVRPGLRGGGIGAALVNTAHARLRAAGMTASYLFYNPPNPLSSVFWPRHGYRPVWTIWEIRPAGALR